MYSMVKVPTLMQKGEGMIQPRHLHKKINNHTDMKEIG